MYSVNGKLYDFETKQEVDASQLITYGNNSLFCKLVDGECGHDIFKLEINDGMVYESKKQISASEVNKLLTKGRYLAQSTIRQKCFHSMLPGMQSVDWDIAIGENGLTFIEGNDN